MLVDVPDELIDEWRRTHIADREAFLDVQVAHTSLRHDSAKYLEVASRFDEAARARYDAACKLLSAVVNSGGRPFLCVHCACVSEDGEKHCACR